MEFEADAFDKKIRIKWSSNASHDPMFDIMFP